MDTSDEVIFSTDNSNFRRGLSSEDREKLIKLYSNGKSIRELAQIFNRSKGTIKWYIDRESIIRKLHDLKPLRSK